MSQPANGTPERFLDRKRESVARGSSMGICLSDLAMVAQLAGWPTPDAQAMNASCDLEKHLARMERLAEKHNNGNGAGLTLGAASQLAGWPTPTAGGGEGGDQSDPQKAMERMASGRRNLDDAACLAGWATPAQRDYRHPNARSREERQGKKDDQLANQVVHSGPTPSSSPAGTEKPGVLNPAFSLWLQGYPAAWACCGARAIASCRKSRRSSSKRSSKPKG